jgi:predicted component of type VI protein secretion system
MQDTDYHLNFLRPPKPREALNVAEVLEGDGSPKSYLAVSLLLREIQEFRALWHGLVWGSSYYYRF